MARGDDLDDTLERATHQALMEFYERHLPVLDDTTIALPSIRNEGNTMWSERVATVSVPELPTHHAGWALTARELPAPGGHSDGHSPVPLPRGVRRSGEG
jgi:hypothetical protein